MLDMKATYVMPSSKKIPPRTDKIVIFFVEEGSDQTTQTTVGKLCTTLYAHTDPTITQKVSLMNQ